MSGPAAVDYSFARPSPAAIKAAGYLGAVRYLAPLPNPKVITAPELQALWTAGLGVALVWESNAQAASGGYAVGHSEGVEALRQADALGWPADRPVYFVMEDPNPVPASTWPAIEEYCHGLTDAGWSPARLGGYGSQALVEHLLTARLISWGWQVGGWSPTVSNVCHLYQRLAPTLAPPPLAGQIDENAVLEADWGSWHPGPVATASTVSDPQPNPTALSIQEDNMIAEIWHDNTNQYIVWANGTKTHLPDPQSGSALETDPKLVYRAVPTELLNVVPDAH